MTNTKLKLTLNCSISFEISQQEIANYESMAKQKGLEEVSAGLLKLVDVVKTQPIDSWVDHHQEYQKRTITKGRNEGIRVNEFIGDSLYRALKIAYALQSEGSESLTIRFSELSKALNNNAIMGLGAEVEELKCTVTLN